MDQEFNQRLPCGVEAVENSMRDPEQHKAGEAVASTSSSNHDRHDKPGHGELPKEMNEMKIRDDNEESVKVGFRV